MPISVGTLIFLVLFCFVSKSGNIPKSLSRLTPVKPILYKAAEWTQRNSHLTMSLPYSKLFKDCQPPRDQAQTLLMVQKSHHALTTSKLSNSPPTVPPKHILWHQHTKCPILSYMCPHAFTNTRLCPEGPSTSHLNNSKLAVMLNQHFLPSSYQCVPCLPQAKLALLGHIMTFNRAII